MIEQTEFTGDNPLARFGHTITPISKDKAILFGGAVGDTGKYIITGDTFLCDFVLKKWKKLQCRGMPPSNRAAHCSLAVDHFLFVYGGALGGIFQKYLGGELADDNLYQLDFLSISDKAYWGVKNCNGTSPGARYGHVMAYLKPYLIIHGGNTGSVPVGDIWGIDVMGASIWKKLDTGAQTPPPRVYHSASICKTGTASGMMVIFGGRDGDQVPLNDTWGLRKHRSGQLDWMKAPYKNNSQPAQRYQHRTLFVGTLLLIIGGRNNQVGQSMPLDIYDTDSSDWYRLPDVERFRHACFMVDGSIYIHGGFDQLSPSVPTDSIIKIDLNKAFNKFPTLFKGLAFELGHDIILHNNNTTQVKNKPFKELQMKQKQRNNFSGQQLKRNDKMQIQYDNNNHLKRSIQTNKSIRLCPQAVVAYFDDQKDIKKISIDQLPTQHRRLTGNTSILNNKQQFQKIHRFFLNNLFCRPTAHIGYPIPNQYIDKLLQGIQKIIDQQSTLLRLRSPVKIFGDIHGQAQQLNRFFQAFGSPSDDLPNGDIQFTNYLFLGDYVDRGTKSIQTLLILFSLKLKYSDNIYLLRGSHQDRLINKYMGFGDQCINKFKQNIQDTNSFFYRCNKIFDKLPIAAIVDNDIFCVHAGIGITLKNIQDIDNITRPIKINHDPKTKNQKIIYQLLWTDPCRNNQSQYIPNPDHDYFKTKTNFKFPQERISQFCNDNDFATIIRSHQPVSEGYDNQDMIMTVFSISDYGGMGNKAGLILAKKNSEIVPKILNPINTRDRWFNLQQQLKKSQNNSNQQLVLRSIGFTPPKK